MSRANREFEASRNIAKFRRELATESDPDIRRTLLRLLEEERLKLDGPTGDFQPDGSEPHSTGENRVTHDLTDSHL